MTAVRWSCKEEIMISGLQKMTLLDYPGKVACTVFLQGCNYRCPFCHNSELLCHDGEEFMTEEAFLAQQQRVGYIEQCEHNSRLHCISK